MTSKFECEASSVTMSTFDGVDMEPVKVPAIELTHTHNGHQWVSITMTPQEWLQAIAAVTDHIPKV